MSSSALQKKPLGLSFLLIITGVIGWFAAFQLTVEKFHLLQNPDDALACDFSILVQCSKNLDSAAGSLFGFPNPILGLTGWVAPIVVGVALLAGARFAAWFWWLFTAGVTGAMALVVYLIGTSIFYLGTLCPWCMVTWAVTIPLFWTIALRAGTTLARGRQRMPRAAVIAAVALTIASYLTILLLAQVQLRLTTYL